MQKLLWQHVSAPADQGLAAAGGPPTLLLLKPLCRLMVGQAASEFGQLCIDTTASAELDSFCSHKHGNQSDKRQHSEISIHRWAWINSV